MIDILLGVLPLDVLAANMSTQFVLLHVLYSLLSLLP